MKITCERWNIAIVCGDVIVGLGWWYAQGKISWQLLHFYRMYYDGNWWSLRIGPFVSQSDVQVMLCGIDGPVSVRDLTVVRSGTADDEDE